MKRHHHNSSRGPNHHSWTRFSGFEPSQHPEWEFLSISTPPSSILTSTPQSLSNLEPLTFPPCEPKLPPASRFVELSNSISVTTSSSPQIPSPTSIPPSLQPSPLANIPQTMIISTSPGKVLWPSFSSTSTSTITQIITTSLPSQPPPFSTPPPTSSPNSPNRHSTFTTRLSTDTKVGFLLALTLSILFVLVLAILFCTRHERHDRPLAAQHSLAVPHHRHNPYAHETQPLTASTPEPYAGIDVFEAGEPKTSLDSTGVRWPEKVVLKGDAKEIREWTEEYGRGRGEEGYERQVLESYGFLWRGEGG